MLQTELLSLARGIYDGDGNWPRFYAHVFGQRGLVRTRIDPAAMGEYVHSVEYRQLLELLTDLRSVDKTSATKYEPAQMLTTRVPCVLYDVLMADAQAAQLSLQKLVVSHLLAPLDPRFQPLGNEKRKGRKPGTQPRISNVTAAKFDSNQDPQLG